MTPTPQSNQQPAKPDDRTHMEKHGAKYILGCLVAGLIQLLNITGQLAPIVCQFSKNPAQCIVLGKAAGQTGELLNKSGVVVKLDEVQVDGTVRNEPTVRPLVDTDGGQ